MFTLSRRKDAFRLILPKEFIPEEINEKYSNILRKARSFYKRPIDFLNETIQRVEVLGFNNATMVQQQPGRGTPIRDPRRVNQNEFMHMMSDYNYRSAENPIQLIDKTLNVDFRHTLGHLNYFLLFESFIYQYCRDTKYSPDLDFNFKIDLLNENGAIYSSLVLFDPLINGIDMLAFDNTSPISTSESFKVTFKYSNFDYQFIDVDAYTDNINLDELLKGPADFDPRNITGAPGSKSPSGIHYSKPQGNSQIIYGDEGGVLKDLVHHDKTSTPGISMIGELIEAKSGPNGNTLPENNKFKLYPYPKNQDIGEERMQSNEMTAPSDNSISYIDEDKNMVENSHSSLEKWEDDFVIPSKFNKSTI